ncbi:MAG: response regulator transcription factor [Actinomycetota bacterium]
MRELRIVIVDDDDDFRAQLRQVVEHGTPYTIVGEGVNGAEAVQLVNQTVPDAVVMDAIMPVVDGIEATATIKQNHPRVFVIGLTGLRQQEQAMRAAGADSCLVKGQSLSMLFDLLASIAQASPPPPAPPRPSVTQAPVPAGGVGPSTTAAPPLQVSPHQGDVAPPPMVDTPPPIPQDDPVLNAIFDNIQDAVAIAELLSPDATPRTIYVNSVLYDLVGRDNPMLVGQLLPFWDTAIPAEDERKRISQELYVGGTAELDVTFGGDAAGEYPRMRLMGVATLASSYVVCIAKRELRGRPAS